MQRTWNRADWMLCATALLFLLAVYFRIRFGGTVWAEGLLFCSEAALVGGIADWFAVKALFDRPLGCPYHTRLIPRRRQQIIEASAFLMKQEFFSRRKLLQYLKRVSLAEQWDLYLKKVQEGRSLEKYFEGFLKAWMDESSEKEMLEKVKLAAGQHLKQFDFQAYVNKQMLEALHSKRAEQVIDRWLQEAAVNLRQEWVEDKLRVLVDTFIEARVRGFWGTLVSLLAQKTELINVKELSGLFCEKLRIVLLAMKENHSHPLRRSLILKLQEGWCEIEGSAAWRNTVLDLQNEILENVISNLDFTNCHEGFEAVLLYAENSIHETWHAFLQQPENHKAFEQICHEVMARLLFEVQNMLDDIVGAALAEMPDERFNQLFYEKVSEDLIWIRMNGSIVGGVIGLLLFCAMTWTHVL